jgi:hypothetical protein
MSRERVDIGLPPAGKLAVAGGALLLVVMVGLLVAQLSVLADSREHIVAQDRKINRIVKGTDPVLGEIEPAADDVRALIGEARPLAREATPFVRDLRAAMIPLLRDLRGADLRSAIEVTASLAATLQENGRLVTLVDLGSDLIRGLRDSEFIPRTLRAADLVPEMRWILGRTLRVQSDTLRTQRRTLRVQRQTRAIQKQTLAIQQRLLAIQEEALVHIRSIDRKTGGPAPAAPPATPLPR